MEEGDRRGVTLVGDIVRTCRKRLRRTKISDSTGAELSGGETLALAFGLRRLLRRHVLAADEQNVGILLPPTVAAVVANLALVCDRRVPVNLNYTLTNPILNDCIAAAGITHVLTSRRFLERFPLDLAAEPVFLEDFRDKPELKPTLRDKLAAAAEAFVLPVGLLLRRLGLDRVDPDDLLTIIFTSGTTGRQKGAMLTFANIQHNIGAVNHIIRWRPDDVLIGILPFFHSFGSTITLWSVLAMDFAAAYHTNPLEAQSVCKLCRERHGTILTATPLFLRNYARRCDPADLASLEVVAAGGEKLPREVADLFEQKFGIRPFEGYGTTEMSPLVAANIPASRAYGPAAEWLREGTIGKAAPGVRVKVVDLETGEALGPGERGMLLVTGPNLMKGYLGQPHATAAALRDGWYVTGDVAILHPDGFIEIVDRESRFAKIGGEMIPHAAVEQALAAIVGTEEDGGPRAVVTSVPDPERGERLVVVHTPLDQTPDELRRRLGEGGLPNLYIPGRDAFVGIDEFPVIGTGKLDLKEIRRLARGRTVSEERREPVDTAITAQGVRRPGQDASRRPGRARG